MVYFSLVHVSLISMVVPEHWSFFLVGGEGERIYPAWPTVDAKSGVKQHSHLCIYSWPEHLSAKRCDMHGLLL